MFTDDLDLGIATGYWQYKGVKKDSSEVSQSLMIPLLATAGYRLNVMPAFNIVPQVALGCSFNYMKYSVEPDLYTGYALTKTAKSKWAIEPLLLAGVSIEYEINHRVYATAGCDAGMLVEMSGIIPFIKASAAVGIRF